MGIAHNGPRGAFLKQNPSFKEGVGTALAKTLSARCGIMLPKATDDSGLPQ
jgi:hypothetical protein